MKLLLKGETFNVYGTAELVSLFQSLRSRTVEIGLPSVKCSNGFRASSNAL